MKLSPSFITVRYFLLFDFITTNELSNFTLIYNRSKKYEIVENNTPTDIAMATNFCIDLFIIFF